MSPSFGFIWKLVGKNPKQLALGFIVSFAISYTLTVFAAFLDSKDANKSISEVAWEVITLARVIIALVASVLGGILVGLATSIGKLSNYESIIDGLLNGNDIKWSKDSIDQLVEFAKNAKVKHETLEVSVAEWLADLAEGFVGGVNNLEKGTYPLWELEHLSSESDIADVIRYRITKICNDFIPYIDSGDGADSSFFATELVPPKKLSLYTTEENFRKEQTRLLNEAGVKVRHRLLIVKCADFFAEFNDAVPGEAMTQFIQWHQNNSTQLRIMVYFDNAHPENSDTLNKIDMPEFKDFAVYGDKLVFAQGKKPKEKNFQIQVYRRSGSTRGKGQFGKYKAFSEGVFKYPQAHCPMAGVNVLVSANITSSDCLKNFREEVVKYMQNYKIQIASSTEENCNAGSRYYDYCPFNAPLVCSQKAS